MKIKKNNKKGFTIVELVIVIAVIGILAAILIPTFISLNNKARMANTESFLKNINTQIAMKEADEGLDDKDVGGFVTMRSAVEYAKNKGFDLEEISPFAGNEIVWDEANHRFAFVNGDTVNYSESGFKFENAMYMPDSISDLKSMAADGKKVYVKEKLGFDEELTVKNSFDAGNGNNSHAITYLNNTSTARKVIIRSNGDQSVLKIQAPQDDVMFYGFAKVLRAEAVATSSLHVYGAVNQLAVEKGHVEVEESGIVFDVVLLGNAPEAPVNTENSSITNKGYIADTTFKEHYTEDAISHAERFAGKTEQQIADAIKEEKEDVQEDIATKTPESKTVGGELQIGSLVALEAFRDAVNAGNNFYKETVKLTADITLNDGWRPIGEGSRHVGASNTDARNVGTFFRGTFDGSNHTISNLNNNGFVPTSYRLVPDEGKDTYAYGLFALVGDQATIRNVKLQNVNIDTTIYAAAIGDSVAALVGYSDGRLTVDNITVSGFVKASDAVGGIVGRSYNKSFGVSENDLFLHISGCTNNANVIAGSGNKQKGAGILGYTNISKNITITNNTNNGAISGGENGTFHAGIAIFGTNATNLKVAAKNNTFTGNKNGTADADFDDAGNAKLG